MFGNKSLSVFLIFTLSFGMIMPKWVHANLQIDRNAVARMINGLLAQKSLRTAHIGISIVSLREPNSPLFSFNGDHTLIPASCMKLATSAAVLDYLGPDYTFETKVYAKGNMNGNGALHGDLVIYGVGDPSMSDRYPPHKVTAALEHLADQITKSGIKHIDGNIIGDGTYFDKQEIGEGWAHTYLYDWYAAKVTALALNDNCINFKAIAGKKIGDPAQIVFDPLTNYVKLINQTKTGLRRSRYTIDYRREAGSNDIHIFGSIPVGQSSGFSWVSIDDPLEYAPYVFKEILQAKGVTVTGHAVPLRQPRTSAVTADAREVAKYISPPLRELLKAVNKNSQNLYAELLLKTLGKVKYGEGSYEKGLKAVHDFMEKAGMDLIGYEQFDGCGLSPYNQISPHQLVGILEFMNRHKYSQTFYDSLSIPGKDGSLRARFYDLTHVMRGKTGGIKNVRTLTAYLTTKSGEPLALSIMSNNFSSREAVRLMENALVEKLAQF